MKQNRRENGRKNSWNEVIKKKNNEIQEERKYNSGNRNKYDNKYSNQHIANNVVVRPTI